jgi:hypothetical protein
MSKSKSSQQPVERIELDRTEAVGYVEILWSDGRRIRFDNFADFQDEPLGPSERAARAKIKRACKIARRAKGRRLKATLARHGLNPRTIRFLRQP